MPKETRPSALTIDNAAKFLGVSTKTLRRWEEKGLIIPSRTSGGHRRYFLSKLLTFKRSGQKTIDEAAKVLGVSSKTLRRWEVKGKIIPLHTTGGHRRYNLSQLLQLKKQRAKTKKRITLPPLVAPFAYPRPSALEEKERTILEFKEALPVLYQALPKAQKRILFASFASLFALIFIVFISHFVPTSTFLNNLITSKYIKSSQERLTAFLPFARKEVEYEKIKALKEKITKGELEKTPVLAATTFQNIKFNVNVESTFADNASFLENLAVEKDASVSGNLAVNGGNITSTASTVNLFNTQVATLNLGGAATAVKIGAPTGTTTINNDTAIAGNLDVNGPASDIAGTLNLSGGTLTATDDLLIDPTGNDVTVDGDLILSDTFTLQVGGKTATTYNAFANSSDAPDEATISSDNDVYIGGDLEIDGTLYANTISGVVSGTGISGYLPKWFTSTTLTDSLIYETSSKIGIGTTSPISKFSVEGAVTGNALVSLNETGNQAILTASASGVPVFTIGRTGNLALNQNSQINTAGTLLLDSTGTLSINTINNSAITTGTGQITLAGNIDATNGVDVTGADLTVGGTNFTVVPGTGNITTAGTLTLPNSNTLTGVTSYTQFSNGISVGGGTTYYLNSTGSLNANNITGAGTLDINGAGTHDIAGTLNLSGNTLTSSNNLAITPTGGSVNITGNLDVSGTLAVGTSDELTVDVSGNLITAGTGNFRNAGGVTIGYDTATNVAGYLRLISAGTNNFSTVFQTGTQTQDITYTLPLDDGSANYILITDGGGTLSWQSVTEVGAVTGTGSTGQVTFWNGTNSISGENNLWWDSTNDLLGVGTNAPVGKLDVTGAVTGKALAIFDEMGDQDIFTASASGTTRFVIQNDGDVGMGTGTPARPLHVVRPDGSEVGLRLENTGTGPSSFDAWAGQWSAFVGTTSDTSLFVRTNNLDRMTILNTGEVGIGDTSPLATLTVGNGDLFQVAGATGNITTAGDIAVNGGNITSTGDLTIAPTGADVNVTANLDVSGTLAVGTANALTVDTSGNLTTTGTGAFQNASGVTIGLDAATNTAGYLQLISAGSNNYSTVFTTGTQTQDITYTLPLDDGSSNYVLATDGGGTLSWQAAGSGTVTGTGSAEQLAFWSGANSIAGENSLWWDSTNDLLGVGTNAPVGKLHVTGTVTGKALAIFDETGDQVILTASASGVPVFTIGRTGNLALNQNSQINTAGTLLLDSTGTLSINTINNSAITTGTGQITLAGNVDTTNGLDITNANLTVGGTNFSVVPGTGNITTAGTLTLPNSNTLTGVAGYTQFSNGLSVGGTTTYYINSSGSLNANDITGAGNLDINGGTNDIAGTLNLSGNNLTSTGDLIINAGGNDVASSNRLTIGSQTPDVGKLTVTGAEVGKALTILNETGDQNILTASASGTTVANLDRSGNLSLYSQADIRLYDSDGSNYTGFQASSNLTSDLLMTLPSSTGNPNYILTTNGSGTLSWQEAGSGTVIGTGSAEQVAFWSGANSIAGENSLWWDSTNDLLGVGTNAPVGKLDVTGAVTGKALVILNETGDQNILTASASGVTVANLDRSGNLSLYSQADIRLYDSDGSNYTGFQASSNLTSDLSMALPANTGNPNYVLTTDGSGTLSWQEAPGVGGVSGSGAIGQVTFWNGTSSITGENSFWWDSTNDLLGVGTNAPVGKLHVTGAVTGKALAIFDETGDQAIFVASESGTTRFIIEDGGNVGVGIADPDTLLHVSNTTGSNLFKLEKGPGTASYGWDIDSNNSLVLETNFFAVESGGDVGIGDATPDAKLDVGFDGEQLRLSRVTDEANDFASFTVDASGNLTIAPNGGDTNITGDLDVSQHLGLGGDGWISASYVANIQETFTDTSGTLVGTYSNVTANPGSASSASYRGGYFQAYTTTSNNITGELLGIRPRAENAGSGTVSTAEAVQANVTNSSNGQLTYATGLSARINNSGTGTISDARGLLIEDFQNTGGGTFTTAYGIFIDSQTAASTNWDIYHAGTSPNIGIANTGTLAWKDASANSLMFLADAGTTGNLDISGTLAVGTANALTVDASGNLITAGTGGFRNAGGVTIGYDTATNVAGYLRLISAGSNNYSTVFQTGTQAQDITYTLPLDDGTSNYVLATDGGGTLSWQSVSGIGGISGSGAAGQVTFWNGSGSITGENSFWWDSTNDSLGIGTATPSSHLEISNVDPEIRLTDTGNSEYSRITKGDYLNKLALYNRVVRLKVDPYALSFDGNDEVQVPDSSTLWLVGGNFTIRTWIYLNSGASSSSRTIVEKVGTDYARDWNVGIDTNRRLVFNHWGDDPGSYTSTGIVPLSTWTHVQVSVDQTNSKVYLAIGGTVEEQAFTSSFHPVWQYSGTLRIGKDSGEPPAKEDFDGKIDELEFSDTVRNTSNFTPSPYNLSPDANTGALWHIDEGTGLSLGDSSGNGNNGTLSNPPSTPTWVYGYVTDVDAIFEAEVLSSQDGASANEGGIQKFGDASGGTWIRGKTQKFYIGADEIMRINEAGNIGIGTTSPDGKLQIEGAAAGKALTILNETGDQNILTASASGTTVANLTRTGDLELLSQGDLRLYDSDNSNYTGFQAPSNLTSNLLMTLPADTGSDNYVLTTDGSGTLTWESVSGTGGVTGTGSAGQVSFWNGTSSITGENNFWWDSTDDLLGVGTNAPVGKLHVTGAVPGKALAILNETGDQDIFSASASGVTKFIVDTSGNIISAAGTKWQPLSNSTSALNIANASGTSFVSFDTTNSRVGIGTSAPASDIEISRTTPEIRLTTSGDSEYTRVTRTTASSKAARYNLVSKPGSDPYALDFDGNDEVQVPDSATIRLAGGNLTIRAWIYLDAAASSTSRVIVEKHGHSYSRKWWLGVDSSRHLRFGNWGDAAFTYTSTGTVPLSTWTHVQFSLDDTADIVYFAIGGTIESQSHTGNFNDSWQYDGELNIGYDSGAYPAQEHFDGKIDEVELSNTIRNTSNFTPQTTKLSPDSNTKALWYFDEGTGTSASDSSGNGNTGTLSSDPNDPAWVTGYVTDPGSTVEALVWSSQDGINANEEGIQTFGDADGRSILQGGTIRFNISASEKARIDASGNFGIGNTSPVGKLDVAGAVPGKALAIFNETGDQDIFTASASGTPRLALTNAGNLQFKQASTIDTSTGNLTLGTAGNLVLNSTGNTIDIDDSVIDLSTQAVAVTLNNSANAINFDFDTLTIDALNNRVGIGTSAPNSTLHITQDTTTGSTLEVWRNLASSSTNAPVVQITQDNASDDQYALVIQNDGTGTALSITGNGSGDLVNVLDGTTEVFTILDGGDVGIGDTSPAATLTVGNGDLFQVAGATGNITTAGDIAINGGDITSTGALTIQPAVGTNLNISLSGAGDLAVNTDQLYIDTSAGRVGIGTSNPQDMLHIYSPTAYYAQMRLEGSNTSSGSDPKFIFKRTRNGGSLVDWEDIGNSIFRGLNDAATPEEIDFARIGGATADVSDGTEDGFLFFKLLKDGTEKEVLSLSSSQATFNINNANIDFAVETVNSDNTLFVDASTDRVGIGTTNPTYQLEVSNTGDAVFNIAADSDNSGGDDGTQNAIARFSTDADTGWQEIRLINLNGESRLDFVTQDNGTALTILGSTGYYGGNVGIGTIAPQGKLHVDGDVAGKALAIFNETGDQDVFTASISGTTRFRIANSGGTFLDLPGSGTSWALCHTTQTGTDNEEIVDCTSAPQSDYAEMYPVAPGITYADVVAIGENSVVTKDGKTIHQLVKSSKAYQATVVGIVSNNYGDFTSAGYNVESEDNPMPVALTGRVPVKIAGVSQAIQAGDFITTSDEPGLAMKAVGAGYVIGRALDSWTPNSGREQIMIFVGNTWYEPALALSDLGNLQVARNDQFPISNDQLISNYQIQDGLGNIVERVGVFANFVVGNIKAGAIETKDFAVEGSAFIAGNVKAGAIETKDLTVQGSVFIAENIKAGAVETSSVITDTLKTATATVDNLLVTTGLVSPSIKTQSLEPLAGEKDIAIKIGPSASSGQTQESGFGKLLIQNSQGQTAASIDETGNATFSGELASDSLKVEKDASIAGELHASKIYADEIISRDAKFADTSTNTLSGITREQIEELLREAQVDQGLMNQAGTWNINTATDSASLTAIADSAALNELALENLYVTGTAAINSLSISESLVVGNDLAISSKTDSLGNLVTSLNTLSSPLEIQSAAAQPLYLMAGLVKIDIKGNVQIAGDLAVSGRIQSSGLTLTRTDFVSNPDSGFGKLLSLINSQGTEVAGISASGAAEFSSVKTGRIVVAGDTPTETAVPEAFVINTNATAGKGRVPAGLTDVTIINSSLAPDSLIYVTPTSSTQNNVLYVKSQEDCSSDTNGLCQPKFIVGFDNPVISEVEFNWWVISVENKLSTVNP